MSSIDVAFRAGLAQQDEVRRKADRMGPIWVALDESRQRRPRLAPRIFGGIVELMSPVRSWLTPTPRRGKLPERQTAQ